MVWNLDVLPEILIADACIFFYIATVFLRRVFPPSFSFDGQAAGFQNVLLNLQSEFFNLYPYGGVAPAKR